MSTRAGNAAYEKTKRGLGDVLADVLEFMATIRFPMLKLGAGFLLCFADCFNVPSPFGLIWLAALMILTPTWIAPLLGILAAACMRLIWHIPMNYAQLCGCALLLVLKRPLQLGSFPRRMLLCGVALLPGIVMALFSNELTQLLLNGIGLAIGVASLPAILVCVRSLNGLRDSFKAEEKACLILLTALLLCGAGHLQLFIVNLGLLLCLILTVLSGYCLGYAVGIMAGLLCGGALVLCGFSPNIMLIVIACGLSVGIMPKKEPRLLSVCVLLLGGALAAILAQTSSFVWVLLHLVLCGLIFLFIRRNFLVRFSSLLEQVKPGAPMQENTYAADMLQRWESAIRAITLALPLPTEPEDIEDAAAHGQFLRAGYERDMIITHLTAMAQAVKRLSTSAQGDSLNDLKAAMEIEKALKTVNFPGHLLYAKRVGGHLRAVIEADVIGFNRHSTKQLIQTLFRQCKICVDVISETRTRIELEEATRFEIFSGCAAISCDAADAELGDAVLLERLSGGKQLIMLSDGMGHGEKACVQSNKTLELLKLCLEAGYTKEQALTAVNGMMLCATVGDLFSTVDLFTVDLWTGHCELSKLGACQSYFVRNGKIKPLLSEALPLGIIEEVAPENTRLKLADGDYLILMSDGVADAFTDEEFLTQHLLRHLSPDVQQSADAFLRTALICAGGIPKDDMTVLVVQLCARQFAQQTAVLEGPSIYNTQ